MARDLVMTMFDGAPIDLDAYFERIGYAGERKPTPEALAGIAFHHPLAIPFENLNPLLRRPVLLDAASLQQKLVREGRGGYCFEQNLLLGHALSALGFGVVGLAARVLWNALPGTIAPRSHMVLRVDVDGQPHVVDAGFGGLTLTGPLRLEAGIEQSTPHERFRLTASGADFIMEAHLDGEWKALYRFDLQRQLLPDYEVASWYVSNHPRSQFVHHLIAARPRADRRLALRNNELAVHHPGRTERRVLTGAAELRDVLEQAFGIRVPSGSDVDAALARLTAAGS